MRRCVMLMGAVLAMGAIAGVGRGAAPARSEQVPRRVLTFYYPWYGNAAAKEGSGRSAHWEKVDEEKHDIAASTHYPTGGAYDSHDPAVIARHCAEAKAAGIDGLIISWWGKNDFTDNPVERILDACKTAGLQSTVYYETVPGKNLQNAVDDCLYLIERYGRHPGWLKVAGRPALFIYGRAIGEIKLDGWRTVIERVNRQAPQKAVFIGDQISPAAAGVFDGLHTYNPAGALRGKDLEQVRLWAQKTYRPWVETAAGQGRISTITIIPGYDDTKIRKPGLAVDRMDGASYQAQWEAAIAARPDWVLVTSFNEWHEGSEIEPSREYGDKYLKLTAEYAKRFKAADGR